MQITETTSVREVLRHYPGTRSVLERYGLMGCGGREGPDEPISLFARAHGVATGKLLADLRASVEADPERESGPGDVAPVPPETETESYRYYLRAAVLIGVVAGAALGAFNLGWIAFWGYTGAMPQWEWWPALIQAHGNAQLFGWTGLFIMGIAGHSLPRMLRRPAPSARLSGVIFGLVLGGLVLGTVAQPLATRAAAAPLFPVAMALQWLGVTLFAGYVLGTLRRPTEAWSALVLVGTLWFWLGATARLGLSVTATVAGASTPPTAANAAYLHAMGWGFLLAYVLGYSLRLLPIFVGLPTGSAMAAWAALVLLTAGTAGEVVARLMSLPALSAVALSVTILGVASGIAALRPWARAVATDDTEGRWLHRFAGTAYFWLAIAGALLLGLRWVEAFVPVSPLHQHAFVGASRHALTVGFVSLMIVGVAWRILPIFSGAPRAHPALVPTVFALLVTGNSLRVGGQVAAGLWGGAWYGLMGLSGWLELAGITLFALDVLRLLRATPLAAELPDVGAAVPPALDAPVGPLVAHRPWLIPVFARHGMGQVSNRVFQRTVGQRVTVLQACRRFNVEPEAFVAELSAADAQATQRH